jgi:hypothetical protein
MGFDINVHLIYGYKLPLSIVIDYGILSPDIFEDDNDQLISDPDYRDKIIEQCVSNRIVESCWKIKTGTFIS